jgi:hypothetical protein
MQNSRHPSCNPRNTSTWAGELCSWLLSSSQERSGVDRNLLLTGQVAANHSRRGSPSRPAFVSRGASLHLRRRALLGAEDRAVARIGRPPSAVGCARGEELDACERPVDSSLRDCAGSQGQRRLVAPFVRERKSRARVEARLSSAVYDAKRRPTGVGVGVVSVGWACGWSRATRPWSLELGYARWAHPLAGANTATHRVAPSRPNEHGWLTDLRSRSARLCH